MLTKLKEFITLFSEFDINLTFFLLLFSDQESRCVQLILRKIRRRSRSRIRLHQESERYRSETLAPLSRHGEPRSSSRSTPQTSSPPSAASAALLRRASPSAPPPIAPWRRRLAADRGGAARSSVGSTSRLGDRRLDCRR